MDRGRNAWLQVKSSAKSGNLGFDLSPKLVKIIDESFARATWANLQAHLRNPSIPWTLCHGDFHAGNILLAGDEVVLVDWAQGIIL